MVYDMLYNMLDDMFERFAPGLNATSNNIFWTKWQALVHFLCVDDI